jgi:chromosome segregation ATPase
MVLLAVPLLIFGAILKYGRSDREVVDRAVDSRVKPVEAQYEAIQPALRAARGLDSVLPQVNRAARRLDEQADALSTVVRRQDELTRAVAAVPVRMDAVEVELRSVRAAQRPDTSLPHVQQQLTRLESTLGELRALQGRLGEQLDRQDRTIRALDPSAVLRRLNVLEGRVDSLRVRRVQTEFVRPP